MSSTHCISSGVGRVTCQVLDHSTLRCGRGVAILGADLEWAGMCVSAGVRRSAERWGMAERIFSDVLSDCADTGYCVFIQQQSHTPRHKL